MDPADEPLKPPSFGSFPDRDRDKRSGGLLGSFGRRKHGALSRAASPEISVSTRLAAPSGVLGRLKTLKKKDLAFILAGLGVLLMTPLAEHLWLGPEEVPELGGGFDRKGPLFPDGTSVYEAGTGGFSPGGPPSLATDVITPLNVRDPSALVMSPWVTDKGPAVSPSAAPAESGKKEGAGDGWSDALAAARRGAKKAASKAPLPRPPAKMTGALRGLAALSEGSRGGPSVTLPPLSAANVPNRARDSNALTRAQAVPGFSGAAERSPSAGGSESLKAAGFRQADVFNKGGSASQSLDSAARETIPAGGSGSSGGRPSSGDETKSTSGNSTKDSKTIGESLAFLRAKLEMERAVGLKWDIAKYKQLERMKFREELMFKTGAEIMKDFMTKALFDPMGKMIAGVVSPEKGGEKYYCYGPLDRDGKRELLYEGPGERQGKTIYVARGFTPEIGPDQKEVMKAKPEHTYTCDLITVVPISANDTRPGSGGGSDGATASGPTSGPTPQFIGQAATDRAATIARLREQVGRNRRNLQAAIGQGGPNAELARGLDQRLARLETALGELEKSNRAVQQGMSDVRAGLPEAQRGVGFLQDSYGQDGAEKFLGQANTAAESLSGGAKVDPHLRAMKDSSGAVARFAQQAEAPIKDAQGRFALAEKQTGKQADESSSQAGLALKAADGEIVKAERDLDSVEVSVGAQATNSSQQRGFIQGVRGNVTSVRSEYQASLRNANIARGMVGQVVADGEASSQLRRETFQGFSDIERSQSEFGKVYGWVEQTNQAPNPSQVDSGEFDKLMGPARQTAQARGQQALALGSNFQRLAAPQTPSATGP